MGKYVQECGWVGVSVVVASACVSPSGSTVLVRTEGDGRIVALVSSELDPPAELFIIEPLEGAEAAIPARIDRAIVEYDGVSGLFGLAETSFAGTSDGFEEFDPETSEATGGRCCARRPDGSWYCVQTNGIKHCFVLCNDPYYNYQKCTYAPNW